MLAQLITLPLKLLLAGQPEAWAGLEARVPVQETSKVLPSSMRWITETRTDFLAHGQSFALLRGGPMWDLHPNLLVNFNLVTALQRSGSSFSQELRAEFEPNVRLRLGPLSINSRHRTEARWFLAGVRFRYRHQARVGLNPKPVAPFLAQETHFDLTAGNISELRNVFGASWAVNGSLRVDLSFLWRVRPLRTGGWDSAPIVLFTLVLNPRIEPVLDFGGT